MIAVRPVRLIESHSERLSDDLVQKVLHNERTRDFLRIPAGNSTSVVTRSIASLATG